MIAFLVLAAVAVAAALGVILARNAVHSVLWLVVHLCTLAVLYMTLHARFLGLVQVLIYAGAVMILFLFVLSLLSARSTQAAEAGPALPGQVPLAIGAAVVLALAILGGAVLGSVGPAAGQAPPSYGGVSAFGQALFGPYLLPFEATALALLSAVVAAVALSAGHDEAVSGGLPAAQTEEAPGEPLEISHVAAESASGGEGR